MHTWSFMCGAYTHGGGGHTDNKFSSLQQQHATIAEIPDGDNGDDDDDDDDDGFGAVLLSAATMCNNN